jgi:hypothetical protein
MLPDRSKMKASSAGATFVGVNDFAQAASPPKPSAPESSELKPPPGLPASPADPESALRVKLGPPPSSEPMLRPELTAEPQATAVAASALSAAAALTILRIAA